METDLQKLYKATIDQAYQHYEEINEKNTVNKWSLDKDKDGMKIYIKADKASGLRMIKAETIISVPAAVIANKIIVADDILSWDKSLAEHDILEDHGTYRIARALSKKVPIIAQREALLVATTHEFQDGSFLVFGRSIDHPDYPVKKGIVRPYLHLFAWHLKPCANDSDKTEVTYILHVDPRGSIPKELFNLGIETEAKKVRLVKKYLEDKNSHGRQNVVH